MNHLLILYPAEFASESKFCRKVSHLIRNLTEFDVIFPLDRNELIHHFFAREHAEITLIKDVNWKQFAITHAIVFDDGEVFSSEIDFLKDRDVPVRYVNIKITRVVNIKKETTYALRRSTPVYEYIGRGSYWGNPYSLLTGESREEVIRKFKYDFEYEKFPNKEKSEVYKLAGKRLGCFCKPDACHGDVLADFLNEWDDGS